VSIKQNGFIGVLSKKVLNAGPEAGRGYRSMLITEVSSFEVYEKFDFKKSKVGWIRD
jgi:hypothetical protein